MSRYRERLFVPWWWWLAAVLVTALLAAEVFLGAPGAATYLPFVVLVPPVLGLLWWLGRIRIEVTDDELRVDDARLPLRFVVDVVELGPQAKSDLLGPAAQPYAFVIQRPWVPGAVQVVLADPADATPYWLISTRDPAALRRTLTRRAPASPG